MPGLIGLVLAWGYLVAVLALEERVFGFEIGVLGWAALTLGAALASALLVCIQVGRGRLAWDGLRAPILALWVSLLCMVILDLSYSVLLYVQGAEVPIEELARFDEHSLIGESYPRLYFPTERNFRLHKPNYHVNVSTFGNFYSPAMLRSPTLAKEVLQGHPVTIEINSHGFREQLPFSRAHVYALGDSLTFGWGVAAAQSWVKLLERRIGCPVYNLGIHDSSPKQELELLTHLLEAYPEAVGIRRLIWTIYEGNDLEDSYDDASPLQTPSLRLWLMMDTLLGPLVRLPGKIKDGAVLTRLMQGRIWFSMPGRIGSSDHHTVDGVALDHPLYRSPKLGARLFYRPYLEKLNAPATYVLEHPNRARLDRVFDEMRGVAERYGFQVTVVLAPTAGRLHGRFYDDFPPLEEPPHFLNYVGSLAQKAGFETVDLYRLMQPYAGERLLYFTDDDHWNQEGNALAAELIAQEAFGGDQPCADPDDAPAARATTARD